MKSLKVNVLKTVNKLTKEMVQRRNEEWLQVVFLFYTSLKDQV